MSFGLTDDGLVIKRLSDIKAEIQASFRSLIHPNINLREDELPGILIGILSERHALIWELLQDVVNQQHPDTASGVNLDNVVGITGIERLDAVPSLAVVKAFGAPGTIISEGSAVSVEGNPVARFLTDDTYTIDPTGEIEMNVTAETPGAIPAPAGSITVIETPVAGWDSVTNETDATIGKNIETDAELRIRRKLTLATPGAASTDAILAAILNIDAVKAAKVFHNTTMFVDPFGRPPKSIEAVVLDGDDNDIALAIWKKAPAGIELFGSTTVQIIDSQGILRDIKFSRPTPVNIFVEIDVTTNFDFPVDGDDLIKEAMVDYALTHFSIGDDIIVHGAPSLEAAVICGDVIGILDLVFRVGTAPAPVLDDNVVINPDEIGVIDSANITINIL